MFIVETLMDVVFPPVCVACRRRIRAAESYHAVCTPCFASIPLRRGLVRGPDFPFVLGAAADYGDPVAQSLIHSLKFRGVRAAAAPLGDLLYAYVRENAAELPALVDFVVVPIPLSRRRERVRGYNQAELIARRFAERASLTVAPQLLTRARHTSPQSETMGVAERRENLRDAFVANLGAHPATPAARDQRIILIDDVATTGATLGEAVYALETAGAADVLALAIAKT